MAKRGKVIPLTPRRPPARRVSNPNARPVPESIPIARLRPLMYHAGMSAEDNESNTPFGLFGRIANALGFGKSRAPACSDARPKSAFDAYTDELRPLYKKAFDPKTGQCNFTPAQEKQHAEIVARHVPRLLAEGFSSDPSLDEPDTSGEYPKVYSTPEDFKKLGVKMKRWMVGTQCQNCPVCCWLHERGEMWDGEAFAIPGEGFFLESLDRNGNPNQHLFATTINAPPAHDGCDCRVVET